MLCSFIKNQNGQVQAANQPAQYYQGNIQNSNPFMQNQNPQHQGQTYQANVTNSNPPIPPNWQQSPQYNQQYTAARPTINDLNPNAPYIHTNESQINSTANQPVQNITSPYKNPNDLGYQTPNSSQIVQQQGS